MNTSDSFAQITSTQSLEDTLASSIVDSACKYIYHFNPFVNNAFREFWDALRAINESFIQIDEPVVSLDPTVDGNPVAKRKARPIFGAEGDQAATKKQKVLQHRVRQNSLRTGHNHHRKWAYI